MIDFISGFFTWAELDEEPIEVREEVVEPKEELPDLDTSVALPLLIVQPVPFVQSESVAKSPLTTSSPPNVSLVSNPSHIFKLVVITDAAANALRKLLIVFCIMFTNI